MTAELTLRDNLSRQTQTQPYEGGSSGSREALLGLLWDVPGRERGAVAEEKIFHVFGDQVLGLLLPRHQAVLVQDHLHTLFPELPRVLRDVVEDAPAELPRHGDAGADPHLRR